MAGVAFHLPTRLDFARAFLVALGMPATTTRTEIIIGWENKENTAATYNPLATTLRVPGSKPFNSVGVQNYPSFVVGVTASVATFTNFPRSARAAVRKSFGPA